MGNVDRQPEYRAKLDSGKIQMKCLFFQKVEDFTYKKLYTVLDKMRAHGRTYGGVKGNIGTTYFGRGKGEINVIANMVKVQQQVMLIHSNPALFYSNESNRFGILSTRDNVEKEEQKQDAFDSNAKIVVNAPTLKLYNLVDMAGCLLAEPSMVCMKTAKI